MKTKKDYMRGLITHKQYYEQFVTERVQKLILDRIGIERIKNSTGLYFNDIPLKEWDQLTPMVRCYVDAPLRKANGEACGVTLSDLICVAKAAAHSIKALS